MRIYYRPGTGRPIRAAWALEEIGVPYESVGVSNEEATSPEHLARQPLGKVPAIDIDGMVLFESGAICLQLADQYPDAGLIAPIGSPERAQVYQWTVFAMTEMESSILDVLRSKRFGDAARDAANLERLDAVAAVVDRALDGRDFLVGDRLTVADIYMGSSLVIATHFQIPFQPADIQAYVERLTARPGFQRASANTESLFLG